MLPRTTWKANQPETVCHNIANQIHYMTNSWLVPYLPCQHDSSKHCFSLLPVRYSYRVCFAGEWRSIATKYDEVLATPETNVRNGGCLNDCWTDVHPSAQTSTTKPAPVLGVCHLQCDICESVTRFIQLPHHNIRSTQILSRYIPSRVLEDEMKCHEVAIVRTPTS